MDDVYRPMLASINEIVDALLAPIGSIQDKLGRIAGGDLTAYVTEDYQGDHGKLTAALNASLDALNEIMGQVRVAADQIASGSSEVASSAQALSTGATRQAAAVEEITASISEMTDQTRKNAENAGQASQLATAAGEIAQSGDERMKAMVRAMAEIDESSQSISKIIKVIDEIAFQTNLLALNA
ncbi:MAG: methyl-accepting chemotaxis protein, partial [bacterium]